MRTSFHHQPEAQHPKSPAIETPVGRLPHLCVADRDHCGGRSARQLLDASSSNKVSMFLPQARS